MEILVGNLAPEVTEEELRALFEAFGKVRSVRVIKDARSGQPTGSGFVEMPLTSAGQAAARALNGKELKGQVNKVRDAHPSADRRPG